MKGTISTITEQKVIVDTKDRQHVFRRDRLKYRDAEIGDPVIVHKGENGTEIYYDDAALGKSSSESSNGTTVLILAIIGIFFFPCAIIALVMAIKERKAGYTKDSKITAGFILSLILVIVWGIFLVICGIYLAVGISILKDVKDMSTDYITMNIPSTIKLLKA